MATRFSEVNNSRSTDNTKDGAQTTSDNSHLNLLSIVGDRSHTATPAKIGNVNQENSQAAVTAQGFPNLHITDNSSNDANTNANSGFLGGLESAIKTGASHVGSMVKAGVDIATPVGLIDHFAGTNIAGAIGDQAQGFANEVVNDPKTLLKDAAIGAAIGIGTVATGGGLEVGLAIGAGVMAASELYKNSGNGISGEVSGAFSDVAGVGNAVVQYGKDMDTVVENKYPTTLAAQQAQQGLQNAGAYMAQTAAFGLGGVAGAGVAGAVGRMAASSFDSSIASGQSSDSAISKDQAPLSTPGADTTASTAKGDGVNTNSEEVEAAAKQQALKESIAKNQSVFNSAAEDGRVVPSQKQLYNVRFQKVTEPTQVRTIESAKAGTTELAQPGQWIATRLNEDGTPNIEDGVQNSWPIDQAKVLKTYATTPEQLESSSEVVAPTKVDGAPVHMVKLDQPLTITTSWSKQTGEAGAYLANYDYNPLTKTPGSDYAIVSEASYKQAYKPVQE